MKIKIIKTIIDEDKLLEELYIHAQTYNQEPYIFMNEDTMNVIASQLPVVTEKPEGIVSAYNGYPVFEHNGLAFGEVEIR